MSKHIYDGILSRYLWVVRLPPQNSVKAKKLSAGLTVRKSTIGEG